MSRETAPESSRHISVPVDAHVHLHPAFDRARFLEAALESFTSASPAAEPAGVLLLVETADASAFDDLRQGRNGVPTPWSIEPAAEEMTVIARREGGGRIAIVAGRQIATRERLEVLVCGARPADLDGLPFEPALERALDIKDALVTIPWGFGKWWGQRGDLVRRAIERHGPRFFVGDNGGRPRASREPGLFGQAVARGMRILPGSDPLPMKFEERRPGSYGFLCRCADWEDRPFFRVQEWLAADPSQPATYGRRVSWAGFARRQVALRLANRSDDRATAGAR